MFALQLLGPETGVAIRSLVPDWLIPAVIVITELGNIGLLLALFLLEYWYRDHRRGAHAIGVAIGGMALITALKNVFDVPRPPPDVNVIPISGYSFPSGHALTASVGYGLLAYDYDVGPKWARYSLAGVIIAVVALSRVVLGVHYVRDVVAGVLVGIAFLAGAIALTSHDPERGFLVGVAVALVAVVVSGGSHDGWAVIGAALGAAVAWWRLPSPPRLTETRTRVGVIVVALPILLGLAYLGTLEAVPDPFVFLIYAVLMTSAIAVPHAASAVR